VSGGLAAGYPTLSGIGFAALIAVAVALGFVAVPPRLDVTRTVAPSRLTVGETAYGSLEVRNSGRLPATSFDVVDTVDGVPLRVGVPGLGAGGRALVRYPIEARIRGLVRLGPLTLERRDPLGLARRRTPLAATQWLWVRPRLHPLRPLPVGGALDFEGRLTEHAPRGSTAFSSLRDYAPGDDPRQIHWRSTARLGTLMVREHVDTNEPTVGVVLDTRSTVLDADSFEAAVELAASIVTTTRRVGHAVSLLALGEDRAAVTRAGGSDLLDRLTAVRRSDLTGPETLVRLAEQATPGGCLVVITGAASALTAQLAGQRRRFNRVVVVELGAGDAGTAHRPGLSVIRATEAAVAAKAFTQLASGGPT
jgi:uncharacterized protein (DUF58 family)